MGLGPFFQILEEFRRYMNKKLSLSCHEQVCLSGLRFERYKKLRFFRIFQKSLV